MEASPMLGLRFADAVGRPAECLALELRAESGLAAQACVKNEYILLNTHLHLTVHTAYPGAALSKPRPSLNLAAPEPLCLKST